MSVVFDTKLVQLLRTWQEEDLKSFDNWLRSPWCNTNKNLIRLFQQLRKYYPDFSSKRITKERLFQKILPDGKFSDRRMNNLLSECYLAAEQFLVFQRFSRNDSLQTDLLLQELQSRHLDEWFFKSIGKRIDFIEKKAIKDWEDHLELFRLNRQIYHHPTHDPRFLPGVSTIVEMNQQLDLLYLLEKAAIINEKIQRKNILRGENHEVEADLKKWHEATEGLQHPAIVLYSMRFAYREEELFAQYQQLRTFFLQKFQELNEKEQKTHLLSLLNDTILLIKKGLLDITESLPLYQLGLKTGILINQGKITRNTFALIVSASNTKGTFEFTDHFITSYAHCLDEKIQEDCIRWAYAHTAYWKKEMEVSLNMLMQYHFKVPYFQLVSRILHTQVYFDLYLKDDSYQFYLFNFLDAFEKWLSREKIFSKMNITSFQRFVQKCRALAKYYGDVNFESEKVAKLLEGEQSIQVVNWLKQKQKEVLYLRRG